MGLYHNRGDNYSDRGGNIEGYNNLIVFEYYISDINEEKYVYEAIVRFGDKHLHLNDDIRVTNLDTGVIFEGTLANFKQQCPSGSIVIKSTNT